MSLASRYRSRHPRSLPELLTVLLPVAFAVLCSSVDGDVRRLVGLWDNRSDRPLPPSARSPPTADEEFTVVSSFPVAVVDRIPAQAQQDRRRRQNGPIRRHGYLHSEPFTPTARDASPDTVLERYPGSPHLWTPYTEDPASTRRDRHAKKPLFIPDGGFLLEHSRT